MRLEGDPDELLRQKREVVDPIATELVPQHGGSPPSAARIDEGLRIVNLWEDEEDEEKGSEQVATNAEGRNPESRSRWSGTSTSSCGTIRPAVSRSGY